PPPPPHPGGAGGGGAAAAPEPFRPAELAKQDGLQDAAGSADGSGASAGAGGNISPRAVFRNFPTAVFGISSMNTKASGSHHFAKSAARNSRNSSPVTVCPSRATQPASVLSSHFSLGIAITAASASAGWPISAFSSATDEIHSPPDLITSFARSGRGSTPPGGW